MTEEALRTLCESREWGLNLYRASQREPENGIVLKVGRVELRAKSYDGIDRCLEDIEAALRELSNTNIPSDSGLGGYRLADAVAEVMGEDTLHYTDILGRLMHNGKKVNGKNPVANVLVALGRDSRFERVGENRSGMYRRVG